MHAKVRNIVPFIVLAALGLTAWYYFLESSGASAQDRNLTASGSIEAIQVRVSAETGGRVVDVLVEEGEVVHPGQPLIRFDDALLQAQLRQAEAIVDQANAAYELIAAGAPEEQRQAAIAAAELELIAAQQAIDELKRKADLAAAQAYLAMASADRARDKATQRWDNMNADAGQAYIDSAHATVVLARDRLQKAKKDFAPYEKKSEDNVVRAMYQARLADAQTQYDNAVARYNNIIGDSNQYELALAEAEKLLSETVLEDARREYGDLQDGPDPQAVALAQARLDTAKAALKAAEAGPSQQQLDSARFQIETVRAAVGVIQIQMDRLVVYAPGYATVLARTVEPGEVASPGAPLLTLARLDDLTITIYVPEDRYGLISLGQAAEVRVDSFPRDVFAARVVHIASKAEFTPRNVQTPEGRRTTVFAVRLSVENPEGKLKPGMPADVIFSP